MLRSLRINRLSLRHRVAALAITSGKVPDSPQEAAVQYREQLRAADGKRLAFSIGWWPSR